MPLPAEPSAFWDRYKPIILGGGALPLTIMIRLTPAEVDLIHCLGLLGRYPQWEHRRDRLKETPAPSVEGMSPEEVLRLRQEGIAQLDQLLQAWSSHHQRCRQAVEEARKLGYFS